MILVSQSQSLTARPIFAGGRQGFALVRRDHGQRRHRVALSRIVKVCRKCDVIREDTGKASLLVRALGLLVNQAGFTDYPQRHPARRACCGLDEMVRRYGALKSLRTTGCS